MDFKKCPMCGSEVEEANRFCGKCRHDFQQKSEERFKMTESFLKTSNPLNKKTVLLLSIFCSYVISIISICIGFNKMYCYSNGGANAYVGGDAYNYIINAGYSVAWFVLAVLFVIVGFTLIYIYCNTKNTGVK